MKQENKEIGIDEEIVGITVNTITPKRIKDMVSRVLDESYRDIGSLVKDYDSISIFYKRMVAACENEGIETLVGERVPCELSWTELSSYEKNIDPKFLISLTNISGKLFNKSASPRDAYYLREVLSQMQERISVMKLDEYKIKAAEPAEKIAEKQKVIEKFFECGNIFDLPVQLVGLYDSRLKFIHKENALKFDAEAAQKLLKIGVEELRGSAGNFNDLIDRLKNPKFVPSKFSQLAESDVIKANGPNEGSKMQMK